MPFLCKSFPKERTRQSQDSLPSASACIRPAHWRERCAAQGGHATGAGALAPHAAQFERLEAILERVLEQRAPPSVQLVEHNPHGHIDVTQLFRDERARNERNEEARRLASQLQQESQLAHEERKAAADRAHEVTLKLALESSENNNLMSALIATAESHARRGRDKKSKRRKQKERNATNKSGGSYLSQSSSSSDSSD